MGANRYKIIRAVGRFQILGGHTLSRVQINMTMKLVGTSTKSSKYWVGKCPCARPVPTALKYESGSKNLEFKTILKLNCDQYICLNNTIGTI